MFTKYNTQGFFSVNAGPDSIVSSYSFLKKYRENIANPVNFLITKNSSAFNKKM